MKKEYQVSDLFFTRWDQLTGKAHAEVFAFHNLAKTVDKASTEYGHLLIEVLKRLRKNFRLVNKINEEQAVDIYNDMGFLNEPWYWFPSIGKLPKPDDYMARHTFDHFIYADNEYSSYIVTQDVTHLYRLVATIYQYKFDKEAVDTIAKSLKLHEWQLNLVFFTYAHVRAFIVKRCKTLMPTSPKPSEEEQPEAPQATGAMWLKLKHRLAETPAFQGYETAGRANMYSALDYLEDLAQQKQETK